MHQVYLVKKGKMTTIEEYSVRVGRTPATIHRWIKEGYLERRFFASKLYFTEEDLEKAKKIKKQEANKQLARNN